MTEHSRSKLCILLELCRIIHHFLLPGKTGTLVISVDSLKIVLLFEKVDVDRRFRNILCQMKDVSMYFGVRGKLDKLCPDLLEVVQLFMALSFTGKGFVHSGSSGSNLWVDYWYHQPLGPCMRGLVVLSVCKNLK